MEKTIYEILEEVASTSSKNDKEAILKQHADNEVLKEVFRLTYSPTINFYQKKLPEVKSLDEAIGSLEFAIEALPNLYNRVYTGNEAKSYLEQLLFTTEPEARSVLERIVLGDLKIGCKDATINKVWKGLIVKPPRLGAASMNEKSLAKMHKIKNLALELKSDGTYLSSVCGEVSTCMTRNGSPISIPTLQEHLSCGAFNGFALEGEMVYSLEKATRESGNGIVTKIVKGTASEEEMEGAMLQVWDCIDVNFYQPKGEYKTPNRERRVLLEGMMERYETWCRSVNVEPKIFLIERHENVSVEEAFELFEGHVRSGMEGSIVKDMDASWKDVGKPAFNIKLKRKEPADLKVVGTYLAEVGSKYEGMLGGFHCESECGTIKVNVGSGFSEDDRVEYLKNPPPIIEAEYDSITEDKKTKQKSLFLPIFKRPRWDKDVADTLEQIRDKVRIK
ncbi:ATP-dependent DNA ligase [Vibrio phage 184E37-3b]|nr:DNA ligase [Vibrio phage 184E37.3a]